MDKNSLFFFLKKQDSVSLLSLLESAYDTMNTNQRRKVFGNLPLAADVPNIDEAQLLEKIKTFHDQSLKGVYYAPFDVNSKNFMNIPEETEEWFETLADLLEAATRVSMNGKHAVAVECFKILYKLIDEMLEGEEIIFADEYGTWMIPGDEKTFIQAYLRSLSIAATPEDFTEAVIPLLVRDSHESLANKVYRSAVQVAGKEQKKVLESAIKKKKIRVK
jgi:hypothetical protein